MPIVLKVLKLKQTARLEITTFPPQKTRQLLLDN